MNLRLLYFIILTVKKMEDDTKIGYLMKTLSKVKFNLYL